MKKKRYSARIIQQMKDFLKSNESKFTDEEIEKKTSEEVIEMIQEWCDGNGYYIEEGKYFVELVPQKEETKCH